MSISAADVKKLRDQTGAGMMDCKKALQEADGDFEKAIEVLRKKGQKLSAKRADRAATEGVVIAEISKDGKKGILVKLSCETDFVAKNDDFIDFAKEIASVAINKFPSNRDELANQKLGNITIEDKITEQVGVIGEKIELAEYETLKAELVVSYIHMGYKAGVIVGLNKADDKFEQAGKDIAMQIAAMKPVSVSKDDVPQSVIDKELEIGREIAIKEGKPEKIVDRIAEGMLKKFFQENTLLNQTFVKDNSKTIEEYLKSLDAELTVTGFRHIELG